jgi:esterase/lipase
MTWHEILVMIFGGGGILTGLIALYKVKSEKTGIDINNMKEMLDEAHKMFNAICEEKERVQEDFDNYKKDNMKYIAEFKERFANVEARLDKAEQEVFGLQSAVYQGYRCKFPANIEDCPVLKEYEKVQCKKCDKG